MRQLSNHAKLNHAKQDFRFLSFPRKQESSKPLKKLDTRFHGYDNQSFQRKLSPN